MPAVTLIDENHNTPYTVDMSFVEKAWALKAHCDRQFRQATRYELSQLVKIHQAEMAGVGVDPLTHEVNQMFKEYQE